MTMATKTEVFQQYLQGYLRASKTRKGEILTVIHEVTGMHRKAIIRRFRALQLRDAAVPERRGRPLRYLPAADAALKTVWEAASESCGELLHPVISEYVDSLQRDQLWKHGAEATQSLLGMSEGTAKARIRHFQKSKPTVRGKSATKPSKLKEIIPVFTGPWKDKASGYGQIDTVAHCGISLKGDFVYSLQYVDAATYWIELSAQWNKGQEATRKGLERIRDRLPFPLRGLHSDTGSEFVNWHVKRWSEALGLEQTRSRPYRKNDNAYVEERNGHVIRKHVGYARLDVFETVAKLNACYEILSLYHNHFIPSRRCVEKERIGSRYRKKFEKATTAYVRVLERSDADETVKRKLREEHAALNPLTLKRELERLRKELFDLQKTAVTR